MDADKKVPILLAEYSTLRAEVLAARGNVAQAAGIFAATLMADVAFANSSANTGPWCVPWVIGVLITAYFCFLVGWNEKNTHSFTQRIREIEREINGFADDQLLVWETYYGWGGMFLKTNPKHKGVTPPKPQPKNPPQSN